MAGMNLKGRLKKMWKKIEGFDKYEVSDTGQIRSLKSGQILRASRNKKSGYWTVWLYKSGSPEHQFVHQYVHRIVAAAFLPNPGDKRQVNHRDGDKSNNSVQNLEWCTAQENILHAYKNGLKSACGSKNGRAKLTENQVRAIREAYRKRSRSGNGSRALAVRFGISQRQILYIVDGTAWSGLN